MTDEQYIEHEVKLRVNDEKFNLMKSELTHLNAKLNFILVTAIIGVILPVVLHYFKMI